MTDIRIIGYIMIVVACLIGAYVVWDTFTQHEQSELAENITVVIPEETLEKPAFGPNGPNGKNGTNLYPTATPSQIPAQTPTIISP